MHYKSSLTTGKYLQCWLFLDLYTVCLLIPKTERNCLIHVRKKSFQARLAERRHWSPQRQNNLLPVTGINTARISSNGRRSFVNRYYRLLFPNCARVGERTRGRLGVTSLSACLSKCLLQTQYHKANQIEYTLKACSRKENDSIDRSELL